MAGSASASPIILMLMASVIPHAIGIDYEPILTQGKININGPSSQFNVDSLSDRPCLESSSNSSTRGWTSVGERKHNSTSYKTHVSICVKKTTLRNTNSKRSVNTPFSTLDINAISHKRKVNEKSDDKIPAKRELEKCYLEMLRKEDETNTTNAAQKRPTDEDIAKNVRNCSGVYGPAIDFTIVTALIDLNRGRWGHFQRNFTDYLAYAVQVLQLRVPMVIFVENKTRDFVWRQRAGLERLTKVIVTEVEDLEYYKDYARISEIMSSGEFKQNHPLLTHPEGFSPEYNILMNSKISLLKHVTNRNYFKTWYFYWMDMGYGHGHDVFPKTCTWAPRNIMKGEDKITYVMLNHLDWIHSSMDIYKTRLPPFLNGGFFGGSRTAVDRYYFLHKETFYWYLRNNMVDDDQTLAVACYFTNRNLFHMVKGWWYDVFSLFH